MEHVLCVPTLLFHQLGRFDGFNGNVEPYLKTLLDPSYLSYRPRDEVEEDPSYKQLIPYCVFRCGEEVFAYTRSKGGEARLDAKRSVGVGGHISSEDGDVGEIAYEVGMRREIEEEVRVEATGTDRLVGLINDDSNDVGKVHLGLVHLFELDLPKVSPAEPTITNAGFVPVAQLLADRGRFETWSQFVLDAVAQIPPLGEPTAGQPTSEPPDTA